MKRYAQMLIETLENKNNLVQYFVPLKMWPEKILDKIVSDNYGINTNDDYWFDWIVEDFKLALEHFGFYGVDIHFSLSYSQSDFAAFTAKSYSFDKMGIKKMKENYPYIYEKIGGYLNTIHKDIKKIKKKYPINGMVNSRHRGYSSEFILEYPYIEDDSIIHKFNDLEKTINEFVKYINKEIYYYFRDVYESLQTDEAILETIISNLDSSPVSLEDLKTLLKCEFRKQNMELIFEDNTFNVKRIIVNNKDFEMIDSLKYHFKDNDIDLSITEIMNNIDFFTVHYLYNNETQKFEQEKIFFKSKFNDVVLMDMLYNVIPKVIWLDKTLINLIPKWYILEEDYKQLLNKTV